MAHIILITGGQRSGKSTEAERLALSLSDNPIYMATAHIWDDDFRERVRIHQERRGPEWTNIEEEMWLSKHDVSGRVVLVDCCTLWLTNFMFGTRNDNDTLRYDNENENENDTLRYEDTSSGRRPPHTGGARGGLPLSAIKDEFDRFTAQDATFIFVTNEIGMGGVSANDVQRKFTDLLGWLNQYIAEKADEVILMVSGIKVKIK